MAVTDIIWPLFVRGLIKPLASLVLSGMRGSELLYQYVIVFTGCFVRECNDFQLFFFFSNAGPSSLDSDMQIEILKKARIIADIEASKIIESDTSFRLESTWTGAWCYVIISQLL